ncbi:MAG: hypothetical protein HY951_19390 [Bacteroidia bacterium]|nr:hypothetical protein [Bacteroidia bacterium]
MKFYLLVLFVTVVLFTSCNNENKSDDTSSKGRVNMLLPTSVNVGDLFLFDTTKVLNWQKEFNSSEFIRKVFSKAMSSEVSVYAVFAEDSTKYTKDEIITAMAAKSEQLNLSEIKSIYFEEEWSMDTTEPFMFEKNILSWYPVRYFKRAGSDLEEKKLIFRVKQGNPTELLAKNVISEHNLYDSVPLPFTKNFDALALAELLIKKATTGKTKVWNPMNVDKALTISEIEKNLGVAADTAFVDDPNTGESVMKIIKREIMPEEIASIVFVEDWYYDPTTFAIKKVITGIGPVRHYLKNDGEMAKTVVFMIYLGTEKTKLF